MFVIWGAIAFIVNLPFTPPNLYTERSTYFQFIAQSGMLLLFILITQILIILFNKDKLRNHVIHTIPTAAITHLLIFAIEYFFSSYAPISDLLLQFRNENGLIERPSGLMSEPSYYGVFAAIFGVPLIFYYEKKSRIYKLLGMILLITAFLINAKTIFVVIAFQLLFSYSLSKKSIEMKRMYWMILIICIPSAILISMLTSAFTMEDNLSSAMRIGSNLVAFNVASEGYGIIGAGIGQFHFLYKPEFAPDFLFYSQEAISQFYGNSESRASTYNLPLRIFVEIGIIGIIIYYIIIKNCIYYAQNSIDKVSHIGLSFITGSFGFLMTQDSYCLPSLAFGIALVLTDKNLKYKKMI